MVRSGFLLDARLTSESFTGPSYVTLRFTPTRTSSFRSASWTLMGILMFVDEILRMSRSALVVGKGS